MYWWAEGTFLVKNLEYFVFCNISSTHKPEHDEKKKKRQFYTKPHIFFSVKQLLQSSDLVGVFLNRSYLRETWNFEH